MAINRQSNVYTVIYSVVLVLVVGVVLSLVYQILKPRQDENIDNDKKRQILAAALITPTKDQNVAELYEEHITDAFLVNMRGAKINSKVSAFDVDMAQQWKKPEKERQLPVFVCATKAGVKYIIPVYGAGLWGPIWGYVAFDDNGDTIYGAYFAHQGETPGLGAEIEKDAFRDQFEGKNVFDDGEFQSVKVVKNGQEPASGAWVHAISGGTITSQGVQKMLQSSLSPYQQFLIKLQQAH